MKKFKHYYPYILALIFIILFVAMGINPVDRKVWIIEEIPVFGAFMLLVLTFNKFRFSNLAYTLMSLWLFMHTIGGHYTFANVPFGWVSDLFGWERNNFDRIAHFIIGFWAFGATELLIRKKWATPFIATLFGFFFIMSVAAIYEIIEWYYAITDGGEAGIEFLGSQGDIWDAQKDMLADGSGAILSLIIYWIIKPHRKSN